MDFDSRAASLTREISPEWSSAAITNHQENLIQLVVELVNEYGVINHQRKRNDFGELGSAPFSVLAFHNKFLRQIRNAFVQGAYYPALTGACALGERILNHLIFKFRDGFKSSPHYKKIRAKKSFDNWDKTSQILSDWNILLPETTEHFVELKEIRNNTIHFRPETDQNDRQLALDAIQILQNIIRDQFPAFGPQPWFIPDIKGASFIKKEAEEWPFVQKIYIESGNCALVGPHHRLEIKQDGAGNLLWLIHDEHQYEDVEVSDQEFAELYNQGRRSPSLDR